MRYIEKGLNINMCGFMYLYSNPHDQNTMNIPYLRRQTGDVYNEIKPRNIK